MGCVKYQFATFELERAPRELGPCLRCWAFGPPLLVYWCWFKCCTLRTLMKAFFVPGREQECIDLVSMMLQNIECDNIKVFFFLYYYYSVNVKPNLILHKSLSEKYSMEDCFCHWIIQKGNCDYISHSSDYFSQICMLISHNSDFNNPAGTGNQYNVRQTLHFGSEWNSGWRQYLSPI